MRSPVLILLVSSLVLLSGRMDAATVARQAADVNTTAQESVYPLLVSQDFASLGTAVVYTTDDGIHGAELWKSDGTAAGTALVADVCPGACSSWPQALTAVNGLVFFAAEDGAHGREVWRTDGTAAGTWMVADVRPGLGTSFAGFKMVAAGTAVYFPADDGVHGAELWTSDGTAAGTRMVLDVRPGAAGSLPGVKVAGNGRVLFSADDGTHGTEPWITDGTAGGTHIVADVNPGTASSMYFGSPFGLLKEQLAMSGGSFLFSADDGSGGGAALWITDGTAPGTVKLGSGNPNELTELDGAVYFSATGATLGYELWRTDGTPGGTALLKQIRQGTGNASPMELTAVGHRIFFRAYEDMTGQELWVTDGTAAGTVLVKDVKPGTDSAFATWSFNGQLFTLPAGVFFFADDGGGPGVWRTDGTAAGTALVTRFGGQTFPLSTFYNGSGALTAGGRFDFMASSASHGIELWSTDGTAGGTGEAADTDHQTSSVFRALLTGTPVYPRSWGAVGSQMLFEANDGASGFEPWITDGTPAGTRLLVDTVPGNGASALQEALPFGAVTLFSGSGGLWRTDGTPAGTSVVAAAGCSQLTPFAPLSNTVLCAGSDAAHGTELWKTDGTPAGTGLLKDVDPGTESSNLFQLTVSGSRLFFVARDPAAGEELWTSDGTTAGTVRVTDILPGTGTSEPDRLTDVAGTLFFAANDGVHGRELWTSDGTPGGTAQVLDLRPGAASSMPDAPYTTGLTAAVGSTFFFVADDGVAGEELWKSDGTAAGTVLVKDIRPGPGGSEPRWLTAAGGRLFFTADDGAPGGHGRELWVSDGTAAGTVLLDLVPGAASSLPRELYRVGRGIVFSAFDPAHGVEPWVSDGTPAGTHLLDDVAPGPLPSSPSQFRLAGPYLFFTANDGTTGFEPWWVYQNEAPAYLDFFTVTPCRLVDTRSTSALAAGVPRTFPLTGSCGIPAGARAVAANVTVTGPTGDGFLTLWPSGTPFPGTSTVNVKTGITRAGNAVVTLHGGAVDAQATLGAGGSVQVVIDVSGYFQ